MTERELADKSAGAPRSYWFVVGTVCIGAFMAALDASIINIALPHMQRVFHKPMSTIEWVSLTYLLTLAGLIVPFGRLADVRGRRVMYSSGFIVFVVGSALCGLSQSLTLLLISRVLQAIGAAMLQANSVSIITANTPASARGKAIGVQASAQGIGLSLGPAIGGALLSFANWRWIFFINVPIGIIGTTLGILLLPKDIRKKVKTRFDFLGAIVLIPAMVALIYLLSMGEKDGWTSPIDIAAMVVTVAGFALFVLIEKRSHSPLVDLSLFRYRVITFGSLAGVVSFTTMYAVQFLVPFYLDNAEHMTAFTAGLFLTSVPIGMTLLTPIAGVIADKLGSRLPTTTGMLAVAVGAALLALLSRRVDFTLLIAGLFAVGAGVGFFTPPNNSSVMGSAPPEQLGVAGGILNVSRSLGMGLGVTLGGLVYQAILGSLGATPETATTGNMISAFHGAFVSVSLFAVVGAGLSLLAAKSRKTRGPVNQTSVDG